jgi:hypothetical protein
MAHPWFAAAVVLLGRVLLAGVLLIVGAALARRR